jgi:hypothetical protein
MSNRFKGPDAEENVACNLIPMIDIMFLLLLFMLGADMSARELEEVVLPKADQVADESKIKQEGEGARTTVNIFHNHTPPAWPSAASRAAECAVTPQPLDDRDPRHYYTLDTIVKASTTRPSSRSRRSRTARRSASARS